MILGLPIVNGIIGYSDLVCRYNVLQELQEMIHSHQKNVEVFFCALSRIREIESNHRVPNSSTALEPSRFQGRLWFGTDLG